MEERRKSDFDKDKERCPFASEHGDRLVRMETMLDNALSWLSKRDAECDMLQKEMNVMRIEQGRMGAIVWLFSAVISAFIAFAISFFYKK